MIRYSRAVLSRPSPSDYGWKGYSYKKLHDPNKWKAKYHRKKGWNFEEALQYDASTDKWNEQDNPSKKFPFNMGFDNLSGPIRHRDFRSQHRDRPVLKIPAYFDTPHQNRMEGVFHDEKAMRVYEETYAKCGPEGEEFSFPFALGDIVEIVVGRAKTQQGPICYIDVVHNYILVAGCNIDYSLKATNNGKTEPREVPVLPEHVRLVSRQDGGGLWEDNEDIAFGNTYMDRIVWRRNRKTDEIIQKTSSKQDPHKDEWVNADAGLHCKIADYPIGDNDTSDYLKDFGFSEKQKIKFNSELAEYGETYQNKMIENERAIKEGNHDKVSKNYPTEGKKNKFPLKGPAERTYQEELAMELDIDLGKPNDTYYY